MTINDASEGTIYHYGSAGALNIIQCHTASYHENGTVAFAEISKGRIVLEKESEIKHIHINKKDNVQEFDTVIIKDSGAKSLPEAITRDQVDVSEAKAVVTVESGSSSETVYVYPYTDAEETKTGTTEKTATQNTTINSALGQLVLDNGSNAGEKAMSNNDKEEAKTDVIDELAGEEVAEDPNADKYVARVGTVGYFALIDAVSAAKDLGPKAKIHLLRSFTLGDEIGEISQVWDDPNANEHGLINSLENEMVLAADITITFGVVGTGSAQINFGDGGKITMNGHTLTLNTSVDSAGLIYVNPVAGLVSQVESSVSGYTVAIDQDIEHIPSNCTNSLDAIAYNRDDGRWEFTSVTGAGGGQSMTGGDDDIDDGPSWA